MNRDFHLRNEPITRNFGRKQGKIITIGKCLTIVDYIHFSNCEMKRRPIVDKILSNMRSYDGIVSGEWLNHLVAQSYPIFIRNIFNVRFFSLFVVVMAAIVGLACAHVCICAHFIQSILLFDIINSRTKLNRNCNNFHESK